MTRFKRCGTAMAALMISSVPAFAQDDSATMPSQDMDDGMMHTMDDMETTGTRRGFVTVPVVEGGNVDLPVGIAAQLCGLSASDLAPGRLGGSPDLGDCMVRRADTDGMEGGDGQTDYDDQDDHETDDDMAGGNTGYDDDQDDQDDHETDDGDDMAGGDTGYDDDRDDHETDDGDDTDGGQGNGGNNGRGPQGNNGFGNGDQDAPGNSGSNNNAENASGDRERGTSGNRNGGNSGNNGNQGD